MPKTISKDTPLAEITLRRYEKPYSTSRRELIRKLCLSLGLLQPGDSRDIIVDILHVLLDARKSNKLMNSEEIRAKAIKLRKLSKLSINGTASSNVRRQLKRLRDLFLIEKLQNGYRITEFEELNTIFEKKIKEIYLKAIVERVKEYTDFIK